MSQTTIDPALLESCVRDVLNVTATRYRLEFRTVFLMKDLLAVCLILLPYL